MPSVDLLPAIRPRRRGLAVAGAIALLAASIVAALAALGILPFEARPPLVVVGADDVPVVDAQVAPGGGYGTDVATLPIEQWLAGLAAEAGVGLLLAPGVAGSEVTARFSADLD